MVAIFAERALLAAGWAEDVRLTMAEGSIAKIETGGLPQAGDVSVACLLPSPGNLHSHSFQRAMAGMTEYRAAGKDSFWTWRALMYRFTAHLTPEHVEAIAAMVFVEMLESGYAAVGEFHYLHHRPDGGPYDDVAELSLRICSAAEATGIGLTHLPVLYSFGGAGQQPLQQVQRRFGNVLAGFEQLVERAAQGVAGLPADCILGVAPHSLRATSPEDLAALVAAHPEGPVHIHIAEQPKEVSEITDWLGARPVEWLLENVEIDARWCLIHATHMTAEETVALARSGAVAGLCPVTEANLGDGAFNGPAYLQAGGALGIGSDSNVRISLVEELRSLEYSQRLRDLARNVMVAQDGSVGAALYRAAVRGGAQALGRGKGEIAVGEWADLLAIDSNDVALCALQDDQVLDGLVFAAGDAVVREVWSAGRHVVQGGRHQARDRVVAEYKHAVRDLMALI